MDSLPEQDELSADVSRLPEPETDFPKSLTASRSAADLFTGALRGFKKITPGRQNSTSATHHRDSPPPPAQFVLKPYAPGSDQPTPPLASAPLLGFRSSTPQHQHARSLSLQNSLEKPLPRPPQAPASFPLLPLDATPGNSHNSAIPLNSQLRFAPSSGSLASTHSFDSRTGDGGGNGLGINTMDSRTSTMDSTSSVEGGFMYVSNSNSSGSPAAGMDTSLNGSQTSVADDRQENTTPRSNGPTSAGPSPQPQQQGRGTPGGLNSAMTGNPNQNQNQQPPNAASSAHLSGLMCNVHRTTGREPHPLVGATTTILGDKLYVFGGRILSRSRPASLTSDLYELDLIRRHWTKLETTGDIPPPRYFHSMCALGDSKMVCYGGMSPQQTPTGSPPQDQSQDVTVMSDIYIYDVPTKRWTYIQTQEMPQGRYAHCACILPSAATFSSHRAPLSALQHNPSSGANEGRIGINIDGTGGAEMIVVGGQDGANHYIEQISVFNLRSLKWTSMEPLGKSCGAYRSVVAPLPPSVTSRIGRANVPNATANIRPENGGISQEAREPGSSMLIYSNYNFLDVKLELQIRSPDGNLTEKPMAGTYTPPGLRFPNGGVIDTHFVVSGTYLTSSKQEYALWALDLRNLTWSRIDAGGSVFSQGSWNRGVLWNRRNTFVILGNRKRSLVDDYNHRRINFTNVCMVELEAFGFYDNPRKTSPMSGFVSASSPYTTPGLSLARKAGSTAGGRFHSRASEDLGEKALAMRELADMDILCIDNERIPVNSRIVARRWGPYFVQLLREGTANQDGSVVDQAGNRSTPMSAVRNSSITITPSSRNTIESTLSGGSSISGASGKAPSTPGTSLSGISISTAGAGPQSPPVDPATINTAPTPRTLPPNSRPRCLYLPHTYLTVQALLHFLYTSSLPPTSSPLCTPQILCSLLQVARPYRIDGLLEAVVERLHDLLDSRNAAAVFNATAMAAGGGRGIDGTLNPNFFVPSGLDVLSPVDSMFHSPSQSQTDLGQALPESQQQAQSFSPDDATTLANRTTGLHINTSVAGSTASSVPASANGGRPGSGELSATTSVSGSEWSSELGDNSERGQREVWSGELSSVIGLQKRGLKGLMEGRRLRERTGTNSMSNAPRVGLGIASG
ncbi:kelch domain-containing protein [Ophiostoma piceae UAMH 11346]|uniref:Kelch domain-containing protein n=1 Tax=Ophiostoma piceae (strain UAMH 11346) TaxID=1262450 RepID=S3BTQ0_OPHP1|nr:kelch domain-containing protein [Ophiostoma piceae UAMH 11346]